MTDDERRKAILELIERYTRENAVSRKAARDALIREGIYTEDGELRVEYGGPGKKGKSAA